MATLQPRWVVGKRVVAVDMRPFGDGKGGTTYDPVLRFEGGSSLAFVVAETEGSEYGVDPVCVPAPRRRGGKRHGDGQRNSLQRDTERAALRALKEARE